MNLAILIGISDYDHCNQLTACNNDVTTFKSVLERLNKFDDICIISKASNAYEAKQNITEFVNKYKNSEVDELVYYFSGHGARYEEDFFYVFSDFNEKKKEVTGFRNTELDGLIRNLSPNLTVKIVDACYSGSTYVKSESDIKPIFEKSAKQNQLNKLYFLHSSSSEEESLASHDYSMFSRSVLSSLTQSIGKIRYRDVMAYVADDMDSNGYPKPTFIVQADNTEVFGEIDQSLIEYLKTTLNFVKEVQENTLEVDHEKPEQPKSFLQLVKTKSDEEYCTHEEGFENIGLIRDSLQKDRWPPDILEVFDIELKVLEYQIPNEVDIARWLLKNKEEKYFVLPRYDLETYYEQEYLEVPQKPTTRNSYQRSISRLIGGYDTGKDYKLEKVEKVRNVLVGIEFTTSTPFKAIQVNFLPKFKSVENYMFTIVPVFSHKNLEVFYSTEVLSYTGWDSISQSKCHDWKVKNLLLKDRTRVETFCIEKINSVATYIVKDVESKLNGQTNL